MKNYLRLYFNFEIVIIFVISTPRDMNSSYDEDVCIRLSAMCCLLLARFSVID